MSHRSGKSGSPELVCFTLLTCHSSRSGEPTWSSVSSSPTAPPWSTEVKWHSADILKPSQYKHLLQGADAVVHSMGILLEADYKGVVTGKEPIWSGLQRAFSKTKQGSQNPLERKDGEDVEPQERDGQITYELMNRDSGKLPSMLDFTLCVLIYQLPSIANTPC